MNYFQKYFLIFLYLNMSSAYAMKREHEDAAYQKIQANNALIKAVQEAADNDFSFETDWQKIKECLEKEKADPNCILDQFGTTILTLACIRENKDFVNYLLQRGDVNVNLPNNHGWTPLFIMLQTLNPNEEEDSQDEEEFEEKAPTIEIIKSLLEHKADLESKVWGEIPLPFVARRGYKDLIKPFIECGADINQADLLGYNPLRWAIEKGNLDIITELCKAGASLFDLDEFGYNAFHLAADLPKEHIKALITHARFDWEIVNKNRQEQIKRKVLGILWAFKQFGFPKDIQFNILAKLPPIYFYGANRGLCKKLREMGYEHPSTLAQLNNCIEWIKQALQDTKNASGKNPLQYLYNNPDYQYKPEVESLLSGSELASAYALFDKEFPRMNYDNLICQIYMSKLYR